MSYFKKFTDFAAGVAAFVTSVFLLRRYMSFEPDVDLLEEQGKLSQFLADSSIDADIHIQLIIFIAIAILAGIIFKKLPYIPLALSLIPAIYVSFMFNDNIIYEQVLLFFVATALLVIGNLVECIFRDKEDGKHRLFLASKVVSFLCSATCFIFYYLLNNPPAEKDFSDLNSFEQEIFFHTTQSDSDSLLVLAILFLVVFVIGLVLYNVYIVDAILSVLPLGYSLYVLFWEKLTVSPIIFVFLSGICFITNVMLAVFENNLSRKEQLKRQSST